MEKMVFLDDLLHDIAKLRDVKPTDKNPLLRTYGAQGSVNGLNAYDFGIDISEPAFDFSSVSDWFDEGIEPIEFAQAANSVTLFVSDDNLCELHFDTVSARQVVEYARGEYTDDATPTEYMHDLALFVDALPDKNIAPRKSRGATWGVFKSALCDIAYGERGLDENGEPGLPAGVTGWGIGRLDAVSTVMIFDKTGSELLLGRLKEEGDVLGARKLLSEYASGYAQFEREGTGLVARDVDNVVEVIRESLLSRDYDKCQRSLEDFLARDGARGGVTVDQIGLVSDPCIGTGVTQPVDTIERYLCTDVLLQYGTHSAIRRDLERHGTRSMDRTSEIDDYYLSSVTRGVANPSAGKSASDIELFGVIDGGNGASFDGPDV